MEDMEYEFLLRRIYKCGRGGAPGADADYYRSMQHAQRAYELDLENIQNRTMRLSTKSVEELKYEHQKECRKVWSYLIEAVNTATKNYNFKQEDIAVLTKATKQRAYLDKEAIDDLIHVADEILSKYETDSD